MQLKGTKSGSPLEDFRGVTVYTSRSSELTRFEPDVTICMEELNYVPLLRLESWTIQIGVLVIGASWPKRASSANSFSLQAFKISMHNFYSIEPTAYRNFLRPK